MSIVPNGHPSQLLLSTCLSLLLETLERNGSGAGEKIWEVAEPEMERGAGVTEIGLRDEPQFCCSRSAHNALQTSIAKCQCHAYCVVFDTENRDQLSVLCKVLSKEIWLSTQFLGDRL